MGEERMLGAGSLHLRLGLGCASDASDARAPTPDSLRIAQYTRAAIFLLLILLFALLVFARRALRLLIGRRAGFNLDVLSGFGSAPRARVGRGAGRRRPVSHRTNSLA